MATILLSILFAALTALVAHYWERVTPYILRHPFLVTADIFCAATILTVDGPSGPFFVATVLTATVAGLLFSARGMIAVVAFQMTSYFAALVIYSAWDAELRSDWAQDLLNAQILAVHPLLYPVAGYVGFQLRRIFLQLAAEQQRREIAEAQAAAAEERARLARDMHDSVAKTLRGAALAAQALPLWLKKDPERAARTADEVIKAAETAAREARDLISDLRDDTPDSPIEEILAFEVEAWSARSGVPAHFTASAEDPQLTVIARHEIVAILRESLTNVERHSGADRVDIALGTGPRSADSLYSADDHAVLHISDNGRGFSADGASGITLGADGLPYRQGHFGIVGMSERAHRAGGSLSMASAPGEGTRVTIRLPLLTAAAEEAAPDQTIERSAQ